MKKLLSALIISCLLLAPLPAFAMGFDLYVQDQYAGRGDSQYNFVLNRPDTWVPLNDTARILGIPVEESQNGVLIGGKFFDPPAWGAERGEDGQLIIPVAWLLDNFDNLDVAFGSPYYNIVRVKDTREINVFLNGHRISFDQKPRIFGGVTYVPMRAVFENLGAEVSYEDGRVISRKNNTMLILKPYNTLATIIKQDAKFYEFTTDNVAGISNGRTIIPLRVLAQLMGADVQWDSATRTITINGELEKFEPPADAKIFSV